MASPNSIAARCSMAFISADFQLWPVFWPPGAPLTAVFTALRPDVPTSLLTQLFLLIMRLVDGQLMAVPARG